MVKHLVQVKLLRFVHVNLIYVKIPLYSKKAIMPSKYTDEIYKIIVYLEGIFLWEENQNLVQNKN